MTKQDVDVKSYVRRGKLVKQYKRKQDRKKLINRLGLVAAAIGIPLTTIAAMRFRYINNLNKFAKQLTANPKLGEVVTGKTITFTIGGFSGVGNTKKASERIANVLSKQDKNNSFVPIDHVFTPDYKYNKLPDGSKRRSYEFISESMKQFGKSFVKGRNKEAENVAEVIYSYIVKNPNKPVNLVGHSGGGILAREINYILQRKGVDTKLVTMASPDFQLIPRSKKELNFVTDTDFIKSISSPNAIVFKAKPGENSHRQPAYLENDFVLKKINSFLFS